MARKIILKDDGINNQSNVPSGYKYIGYDGEIVSQKSGATVSPICGVGAYDYDYIEVPISSTQILQLNSTGVILLPAPVAGFWNDVDRIILEYTYGSSPYAIAGVEPSLDIYYGINNLISKDFLMQSQNTVVRLSFSNDPQYPNPSGYFGAPFSPWFVAGQGFGATSVQFSCDVDPTGGNGTILAKIWYKVRTFGTEL
jgi:hypothetical protein